MLGKNSPKSARAVQSARAADFLHRDVGRLQQQTSALNSQALKVITCTHAVGGRKMPSKTARAGSNRSGHRLHIVRLGQMFNQPLTGALDDACWDTVASEVGALCQGVLNGHGLAQGFGNQNVACRARQISQGRFADQIQ